MSKIRCCRFHNLFIFMLVLCAFSLASHYIADAVAFDTGATSCQTQQTSDQCTNSPNDLQGADLHGGFMLNEVQALTLLPTLWVSVEVTEPYSLTWKHPALIRPPIL